MAKSGLIPRGSHMDATWHLWPRGSATRAHAAYTYIYNLYSLYNGYSAFRISEGYSNPLKPSRLINALVSFNFLRVGLKSHTVFKYAGDVDLRRASDRARRGRWRVHRVRSRSTGDDHAHVLN